MHANATPKDFTSARNSLIGKQTRLVLLAKRKHSIGSFVSGFISRIWVASLGDFDFCDRKHKWTWNNGRQPSEEKVDSHTFNVKMNNDAEESNRPFALWFGPMVNGAEVRSRSVARPWKIEDGKNWRKQKFKFHAPRAATEYKNENNAIVIVVGRILVGRRNLSQCQFAFNLFHIFFFFVSFALPPPKEERSEMCDTR